MNPALPHILLDMDGPLSVWEDVANEAILEIDPSFPVAPAEEWTSFRYYQNQGLTEEQTKTLFRAYNKPGFYRLPKPVVGSIDAVREMSELVNITVATRPMFTNDNCESDKKWWLRQYHGDEIAQNSTYLSDKTMLRGSFIIEDHPDPAEGGFYVPEWTQIVFDKPYNQDTPGLRIMGDWSNWRQVFEEAGLIP